MCNNWHQLGLSLTVLVHTCKNIHIYFRTTSINKTNILFTRVHTFCSLEFIHVVLYKKKICFPETTEDMISLDSI